MFVLVVFEGTDTLICKTFAVFIHKRATAVSASFIEVQLPFRLLLKGLAVVCNYVMCSNGNFKYNVMYKFYLDLIKIV